MRITFKVALFLGTIAASGSIQVPAAYAQEATRAVVQGVVLDEKGDPVEGATIRFVHSVTDATELARTDKQGRFIERALEPGARYLVEGVLPDGRSLRQQEVLVRAGENTPLTMRAVDNEIVISGQRLQNARIIQNKRQAVQILDSISQDEIGRQPDFNVADALRRVAGVAGIREQEEAQYISLRGLNPDFTLVTLDGGVLIGAEDAGRRVSIQSIPASIAYQTDVLKSRTADIDGNAIGGQVNIRTRSAYDANGQYYTFSAIGGYFLSDDLETRNNAPSIRLDGAFSDTFGANEEWGLVVGASYFRRDQDQERSLNINYNAEFSAPIFPIWNGIENRLERIGGFAKIEYRPSDSLRMFLSTNLFQQTEDVIRLSETLFGRANNVQLDGGSGGTVVSVTPGVEYAEQPIDLTTYAVTYNLDYDFGANTSLRLRASYSDSVFDSSTEEDITFRYSGPQNGGDFSFDFVSDPNPDFTFVSPDLATDNGNYRLSSVEDARFVNEGQAIDIGADVEHVFADERFSALAGGRYRRNELNVDRDSSLFVFFGSPDPSVDDPLLSDFGTTTDLRPRFASGNIRQINSDRVLAFFDANPDAFRDFSSISRNTTNDFSTSEDVTAAYASVRYSDDRLAINAGGRWEQTDLVANGFEEVNGEFRAISEEHDYSNFLPSFGASYYVNEKLKTRVAYSRALGRPDLLDLRPTRSIFVDDEGRTVFQGGNPRLSPRVSDNFDLSIEYYFDEGRSLASFAVFHKEIRDEIFTLRTEGSDVDGNPAVFIEPLNAEDAQLTGFEINFIKDRLDFLPAPFSNLGVSANYTFVDADAVYLDELGESRAANFLLEQPENLANVTLFYQSDRLEIRAAYSYIDRFVSNIDLTDISGSNDDAVDDYDTVDLQVRYKIGESIILQAEGRNLFNSVSQNLTGPNFSRGTEFTRFGTALFFGFTIRN